MHLQERYKEADFLQPRHIEAVEHFMYEWSQPKIQEFVADNLVTHQIGQLAFQTLQYIPPDPNN